MPPRTALPPVEQLVEQLGLLPHPEGGFYRETHRDALVLDALPQDRFASSRAASTAIYYLLRRGDFSAFHRIRSDEVWHHYLGATLGVHILEAERGHRRLLVGHAFAEDSTPQAVVPAGAWFASRVEGEGEYALVGCTVAPGFDFDDFELASREALCADFPEHRALIHALTRG